MKKKILAGLLCVAMTVAATAGCGSSGDAVAPSEDSSTPSDDTPAPSSDEEADTADTEEDEAYHFEIIVPSAQSSYGQAFARGVEQAAEELGVTCNCTGPDDASNAAARADMLQKAIDAEGTNGIGFAASGEAACFDALQAAKDKGIPVVCFDGVQEAPEGAVYATITTDNYQAGTIAAENLYGISNRDNPP